MACWLAVYAVKAALTNAVVAACVVLVPSRGVGRVKTPLYDPAAALIFPVNVDTPVTPRVVLTVTPPVIAKVPVRLVDARVETPLTFNDPAATFPVTPNVVLIVALPVTASVPVRFVDARVLRPVTPKVPPTVVLAVTPRFALIVALPVIPRKPVRFVEANVDSPVAVRVPVVIVGVATEVVATIAVPLTAAAVVAPMIVESIVPPLIVAAVADRLGVLMVPADTVVAVTAAMVALFAVRLVAAIRVGVDCPIGVPSIDPPVMTIAERLVIDPAGPVGPVAPTIWPAAKKPLTAPTPL